MPTGQEHSDGFILSSLSSPLAQLTKPSMTKAVSYNQYPNTHNQYQVTSHQSSLYGKQSSHPPNQHRGGYNNSPQGMNPNAMSSSMKNEPVVKSQRSSRSKSSFGIKEEVPSQPAMAMAAGDFQKMNELQKSPQNMGEGSASSIHHPQRRHSVAGNEEYGDQGQCVVQ